MPIFLPVNDYKVYKPTYLELKKVNRAIKLNFEKLFCRKKLLEFIKYLLK